MPRPTHKTSTFPVANRATKSSRMKRAIYDMPPFISEAINGANLLGAYRARPMYQQNDYVGWITRAKTEMTKQRRLNQMLRELEEGTHYMRMPYAAARSKRSDA